MFCEASSGTYHAVDDGEPRLRLSASSVIPLHALGYRQDDPRENCSRRSHVGSLPDTRLAADLMLAALFDAYGARLDSEIEIDAPKGGPGATGCGTPAF